MDLNLLAEGISWWAQSLAVVFAIVCVVLIILVLLQKGRGAGLASAFGGAGGQSAFGGKTGDVFTLITIIAAAAFLLLAMIVSVAYKAPPSKYDEPAISQNPAGVPAAVPGGEGMPVMPATDAPATSETVAEPTVKTPTSTTEE